VNRLEAAIAVIQREGRYFLQRRSLAASRFPGLWEFPGGKLEAGESAPEALRRELLEELGWRPEREEALLELVQVYAEFEVVLHAFLCSGAGRIGTELGWGWFLPGEMRKLGMPEGTRAVVARLCGR